MIERKISLKEFTVCYTFDHEIITEKIIKELDVTREEVEQEVIEKMDNNRYFIVKNHQKGNYRIDSSLVRYVQIINEKILIK
ncbi:hypothetical protein R4Z10_08105 [Niallia sp. XMNu-256]|uniref:hypothetical protein n=1 Tax=Niallia sp. XMNu-256 TaxID=3082444 RepID=UPI0030D2DFA7